MSVVYGLPIMEWKSPGVPNRRSITERKKEEKRRERGKKGDGRRNEVDSVGQKPRWRRLNPSRLDPASPSEATASTSSPATLLRRRVYAQDIERHSTPRPFRRNMGQGRHLGPRRAHVDSANSIIRLYIVNPWLCASARPRARKHTHRHTDASIVRPCHADGFRGLIVLRGVRETYERTKEGARDRTTWKRRSDREGEGEEEGWCYSNE